MQNNAFTPFGPTYAVSSTAPVQVLATNNLGPTSYRIRNTNSSANYISWSPALPSGMAPTFACTSPVAGTPSVNTVGMIGSSIEVFQLPSNCWFIATAAFEVTPGEGF